MGGNSIADTAPPMAHAIGGSLGSALALLLLYPLERARVEMQTTTAKQRQDDMDAKDINDKVQPLPDRGGGTTISSTGALEAQTAQQNLQARDEGSDSWASASPQLCVPQEMNSSVEDDDVSSLASEGGVKAQATRRDPQRPSTSRHPPTGVLSIPTKRLNCLKQLKKKRQQKPNQLGLLACIYRLHQKQQLYQGVAPVVTTMAASNFVFFYMHSFFKQLLLPATASGGPNVPSSKKLRLSLIASSLAGIINVLMTNPMWVANLRIVTSDKDNNLDNDNKAKAAPGLWREMKQIVKSEGWAHLWNGTPASLLLVSNPVIQFVAYEQLKHWILDFRKEKGGGLKPLEAFLMGALAKAVSTVLTYPLQLAQTVLRVQKQRQEEDDQSSQPLLQHPDSRNIARQPSSVMYKGTLDCLMQIYASKGLDGWFTGMRTKLLQTVLTAAFTFLSYEQIIRAIMAVHKTLLLHRPQASSPPAARRIPSSTP